MRSLTKINSLGPPTFRHPNSTTTRTTTNICCFNWRGKICKKGRRRQCRKMWRNIKAIDAVDK